MFNKILVANRGEIALRIIRACRELNIKTVAVYSQADELSLHTRFADEAICIGPSPSNKSYLNIPSIMSAAELTNADAIHPGYGFLAENPFFSSICKENNITFIGPDSDIINAMGDKANAKSTMISAGVPVLPGSDGIVSNFYEAKEIAESIGYPVILKAVAGGGGKGMRIVKTHNDLESAFNTAEAEAQASFNNGDLYLEKYINRPRHIEVQILGDTSGNIVSLGERECSIQRRHQKLIEETPCLALRDEDRTKLMEFSRLGGSFINYVGAGTIEFLMDENNNFYFMEMNTRIQVEHPVTEMVTGVDLVRNQILVHAGIPISDSIASSTLNGHSIECRINAEDPEKNFMPSPGTISSFHMPGGMGVRVDTHVYAGYIIPPYYDSMIAKLIIHSPSRKESITRMLGALDECVIEGIKTTIPFHKKILQDQDFINGDISTNFIEEKYN